MVAKGTMTTPGGRCNFRLKACIFALLKRERGRDKKKKKKVNI